MEKQATWRLRAKEYLGEISALCFLPLPSYFSSLPYLLAGTGSQILVYNLKHGEIIESFQVFDGIRVHGIVTCSSNELDFVVAVFGEKRVKLFKLSVGDKFVSFALVQSLPRLCHWVLDVCYLKDEDGCVAIGCTDNSVRVWNVAKCSLALEVQSPDRCLLYSMRMWGDNLEDLRIASGTIFNEIIVWKVVPQDDAQEMANPLEENSSLSNSLSNSHQLQQHSAAHISRLIGHEGSIFRITWSSDGRKLVSVSDDRSARIWEVEEEQKESNNYETITAGPVLFGHNARVWDCCIFNSLIVTAGEDCTCRVWDLCGKQLMMIKEHIGRGVWRCLYDPNSSVIVTAGFDSAIKVHWLPATLPQNSEGLIELKPFMNEVETFTTQIPNSCHHSGLTDSKSEYVRCLHLTSEDTLYVATNNGYLYHAKILDTHDVNWTKLVQVSEEVPIICMDLLSENSPKHSFRVDDYIALGDGKGNMTIVKVKRDTNPPEVDFTITWSAGKERQLLGTYWCKALGPRFVFSTDPRGILKLWKLHDPQSASRTSDVLLLAEFQSCFGIRIICLDASFEDEVLVCGDLRGNLILFPLLKSLLQETLAQSEVKVPPLTYFKGAHGISSVSSVTIAKLSLSGVEICSTGGDGCVCYFEYDQGPKIFEFVGMKHLKELSLVQKVWSDKESPENLAHCGYAVGFASTEFIIWNFKTEAKIVQIPCGGWRRPNSYYLGDVPMLRNCFTYVKDEIIYFRRQWVPNRESKIFPQNLHIQFHGREVHSLCFVSGSTVAEANGEPSLSDTASWIASGCEDGTVRLTRFTPSEKNLFSSKLLGEHVGGSAVRSICCVSKLHMIDRRNGQRDHTKDKDNPFLLISVGAKRVLTSWLMRDRSLEHEEKSLNKKNHCEYDPSIGGSSSMSFKWLSSDMPAKNSSASGKTKDSNSGSLTRNVSSVNNDAKSEAPEEEVTELKTSFLDKSDDDWRFMAVTAFLVRCIGSRLTICFVVVASSDATLALRALVLPHRLWFDVASLEPLSSPVLALQHVIVPMHLPSEGNYQISNVYVVISGATDGSVALWDLTDTVEAFVQHLSSNDTETLSSHQTRPRTGRGSQGGRWWRSVSGGTSKKRPAGSSAASQVGEKIECSLVNDAASETLESNWTKGCKTVSPKDKSNASLEQDAHTVYDPFPEMRGIQPLLVLNNVHQSGVNSLHVSNVEDCHSSDDIFQFSLISGGDDQALHCLRFEISPSSVVLNSEVVPPPDINSANKSTSAMDSIECSQSPQKHYRIRCVHHNKIASAHSSAIKGVWTDGTWVFSTGLDQRIRCWFIEDNCKLREQTHLIISVPEPEALHAKPCGRNKYEIAVAGRGMQIVEFSAL